MSLSYSKWTFSCATQPTAVRSVWDPSGTNIHDQLEQYRCFHNSVVKPCPRNDKRTCDAKIRSKDKTIFIHTDNYYYVRWKEEVGVVWAYWHNYVPEEVGRDHVCVFNNHVTIDCTVIIPIIRTRYSFIHFPISTNFHILMASYSWK